MRFARRIAPSDTGGDRVDRDAMETEFTEVTERSDRLDSERVRMRRNITRDVLTSHLLTTRIRGALVHWYILNKSSEIDQSFR